MNPIIDKEGTNMNKQEDLTENSVVKEEVLEKVTGGEGSGALMDKNCYFEAAEPMRSEWRYEELKWVLWMECKSRCFGLGYCACHGTRRCVNRMHEMEKLAPTYYFPYPSTWHNHRDPRKVVITNDYNG